MASGNEHCWWACWEAWWSLLSSAGSTTCWCTASECSSGSYSGWHTWPSTDWMTRLADLDIPLRDTPPVVVVDVEPPSLAKRVLNVRTLLSFAFGIGLALLGIPGLSLIMLLSWFANCVVPAKLGDAYRGYLLKEEARVSFSKTMG